MFCSVLYNDNKGIVFYSILHLSGAKHSQMCKETFPGNISKKWNAIGWEKRREKKRRKNSPTPDRRSLTPIWPNPAKTAGGQERAFT